MVLSTWSPRPRDVNGQARPYEAALEGHALRNPEQPVEILRTIRSLDPCIACAVHLADERGEKFDGFRFGKLKERGYQIVRNFRLGRKARKEAHRFSL